MAKQIGEYKITGTITGITFYEMEGQYYARMKSSLDGNRVKRDPRFKRTMEWAHRLARGSQLASKVYRSLPRQEQVYALYKELKSLALYALKEGKSEAEVLILLQQRVGKVQPGSILQPKHADSVMSRIKAPAVFKLWQPGGKSTTNARRKEPQRRRQWAERCRTQMVPQRE